MTCRVASWGLALGLAVWALGCGGGGDKGATQLSSEEKEKKVAEARAKLDKADRALVEAQDYCPIMRTTRLGSMGVPIKLTLKGKAVFVCCERCKSEAEDDPAGALKALAELKAHKGKK